MLPQRQPITRLEQCYALISPFYFTSFKEIIAVVSSLHKRRLHYVWRTEKEKQAREKERLAVLTKTDIIKQGGLTISCTEKFMNVDTEVMGTQLPLNQPSTPLQRPLPAAEPSVSFLFYSSAPHCVAINAHFMCKH